MTGTTVLASAIGLPPGTALALLTLAVGVLFVLFLVLALAAPLVLYVLVRDERERDAANVADREAAERAARRDTRDR